jgi:hypothetical protein
MNGMDIVYEIAVLVPNEAGTHLLVVADVKGWRLPQWQTREPHFFQTVGPVNRGAWEWLGMRATTLRALAASHTDVAGRVRRVYEMEPHGQTPLPAAGRWLGRQEAAEVTNPEERHFIERWFGERADDIPQRRRAWARPGWLAEASAWLAVVLWEQGRPLIGPIEQVRTWERSCILRAEIAAGYVCLKALPPMFAHEVTLTTYLAARHPAHTVEVLEAETERHWLLMEEMRGTPLNDVGEIRRWEDALSHFARIQIETVGREEELRALGCPSRPLATLPARMEPVFAVLSDYLSVSAATADRARALAPLLRAAAMELSSLGIPEALEHGDLHPANVMQREGAPVFFDWSDASLAHPFFSVVSFLEWEDVPPALRSVPDLRARLRDAYLAPWQAIAPRERLLRAFALAERVAPLHFVLIYADAVLPGMEDAWEMEGMVGFYLRMLVRASGDDQ